MIWGWIPSLSADYVAKPCLSEMDASFVDEVGIDFERGILVPENGGYSYKWDKNCVEIGIERNFIFFDGVEDLTAECGEYKLSFKNQYIYRKVLMRCKMYISGEFFFEPLCVEADSLEDAARKVLNQLCSTNYYQGMKERYGQVAPVREDMYYLIFHAKYGIAFLKRYQDLISEEDYCKYYETFISTLELHQSIDYYTREDYVATNSRYNYRMNRSVARMSYVVAWFTCISVITSVIAMLLSFGDIQFDQLRNIFIISISLVTFLIFLSYILRGSRLN